MSLGSESVVQKVQGQASRVMQGEALIVLTEQRKLHRLNGVGTRVWELCDGRTLAAIVETIVAEFEVDHEIATRDVTAFVEELRGLGALSVTEPDRTEATR
jgi:GeoRSP system PqqD family protein